MIGFTLYYRHFSRFFAISFLCFPAIFCACSSSPQELDGSGEQHQIYVVSQGWHTGVVVPASCLPDTLWPDAYPFDEYPHLQIGWGDKDFYQNKEGFNPWYAAKAVFWPTASALQVVGLHKITNLQYYASQTIALQVSEEDFRELCHFLLSEFAVDDSGKLIPLQDGLFGESRFFQGNRSYYFPRNSNVWTARALNQAGLDISPIWYQTQGALMRRVREEGEVIYSDE